MSESVFKRAMRVGQLLQKELGDLLVNELKDPRVGFVTVTEVRPSDDLRSARVFVSILGDGRVRQETLIGLREAAGFLRHELAQRVNLRFTPNLVFVLDTTLDKVERLDKLIAAAKRGDSPDQALGDAEGLPTPPVETLRSELVASAQALGLAPGPQHSPREESSARTQNKTRRRSRPGRGKTRRAGQKRKRR